MGTRRQKMTNILEATPFGATSTTDDVLSGVNLKGKRILVTGVSAGLGVETARSLAAHGAHVVGAARDLNKAKTATEQVLNDAAANGGSLELVELDLANLKSVRACSDRLLAKAEPFDVVIANAGVMATQPMDSKRSSARITWATLSWSTGLRLLSAMMAGVSSTCLLRGIATRTLILRTQVSSTRPMSLSLPMADPKRRTSSSRSHSTNVIAIEAFVRRLYIREAYKLNLRAISMPAGCKRSSNRSISNSQRRENRLSSLRPSRRELQPRCGLLWSLRPTRSAADIARTAMSAKSCRIT